MTSVTSWKETSIWSAAQSTASWVIYGFGIRQPKCSCAEHGFQQSGHSPIGNGRPTRAQSGHAAVQRADQRCSGSPPSYTAHTGHSSCPRTAAVRPVIAAIRASRSILRAQSSVCGTERTYAMAANARAESRKWRSHTQKRKFGDAAKFPVPVIQPRRSKQISNRPFAAVSFNNRDADKTDVRGKQSKGHVRPPVMSITEPVA